MDELAQNSTDVLCRKKLDLERKSKVDYDAGEFDREKVLYIKRFIPILNLLKTCLPDWRVNIRIGQSGEKQFTTFNALRKGEMFIDFLYGGLEYPDDRLNINIVHRLLLLPYEQYEEGLDEKARAQQDDESDKQALAKARRCLAAKRIPTPSGCASEQDVDCKRKMGDESAFFNSKGKKCEINTYGFF